MSKSEPEVQHVDPIVLRDLESKYADISCPIHGSGPKFDVKEDGSIVETMCCAVLLQIVREFQTQDGTLPTAEGTGEPDGSPGP